MSTTSPIEVKRIATVKTTEAKTSFISFDKSLTKEERKEAKNKLTTVKEIIMSTDRVYHDSNSNKSIPFKEAYGTYNSLRDYLPAVGLSLDESESEIKDNTDLFGPVIRDKEFIIVEEENERATQEWHEVIYWEDEEASEQKFDSLQQG